MVGEEDRILLRGPQSVERRMADDDRAPPRLWSGAGEGRLDMFRICVTKLLFALAAVVSTVAPAEAASDRPNILWIIGDDWGVHASVYGTSAIDTSHVDRLASEGVRFTHAYVTAPVCSAMRSALITGVYQTSIGAMQHRTQTKRPLPDGVQPITRYFHKAGYFTSNGNYNLEDRGKTDYNFEYTFSEVFDGHDWRRTPDGKPFFAQVQISNPHRQFKGANKDPSRPAQLDLPAYYPDHPLARKDYADYLADVERFDQKVGAVLDRLAQDGLADNTIVMVFGDHGAPHVRDKQWLYDGGIHIPLIVRDPTGKLVPEGRAGTVDHRMISHIDISATSLALAGIALPEAMQGRDISQPGYPGREAVFAAKDRLDGVVDRVRSVQVGDMKLIRNFDPGTPYMLGPEKESAYKLRQYPVHTLMKVMHERGLLTPEQDQFLTDSRPEYELYDLARDPNEFDNLADDPQYADALEDLKHRLEAWIEQTGDQGGEPDPDAQRQYRAMRQQLRDALDQRLGPDATDEAHLEWWAKEYEVDLDLPLAETSKQQSPMPGRSGDEHGPK